MGSSSAAPIAISECREVLCATEPACYRSSSSSSAISRRPPPYFPTTGRFQDNRYIALDPAGFNQVAYFRTLTPDPCDSLTKGRCSGLPAPVAHHALTRTPGAVSPCSFRCGGVSGHVPILGGARTRSRQLRAP